MSRATLAVGAAGLLACALAARPAHACVEPSERPHHVVSLRAPIFFAHGVGLAYERFLPSEASVVVGLSARKGAGGDFDSTTVAATTEARWWPMGAGPTGCRERYEMIDLYLGARLDVGRTSLRDALDDRALGAAWTIAVSAWLGWRFAIGRFEVTPAAATMLRSELGGGLAPYTSVTFAYDLTLGWMF